MSLLPATLTLFPQVVAAVGLVKISQRPTAPRLREKEEELWNFYVFCIPVLCNIVVAVSSCTYCMLLVSFVGLQ